MPVCIDDDRRGLDGVGNRTTSHLSTAYGYQPFNRMSSTATSTMNYDANGNLVTKSQGKDFWSFAWDHENRLTTAATRKQTIRYRYDALGRRIQRIVGNGRENTKFVYDGLDGVMDDNSGVLTKYQNGPGIDNKLKMSANGVSKYFIADHLGSTNALTDASGTVLEQTAYDSFGNATNQLSTRYAFTGREFDNFTGLHYYRARWYDGNLGRFISEDPIGFAGGDVNLYGYVWNNSIKLVDPFGTDGGANLVLGGGALIGGGGAALSAALVAAAPPAAVVVGGALLIYGAWELGEYIARRRYPDQYPETQTKPETCSTKPKSNPTPQVQPAKPEPFVPTSPTEPSSFPRGRRGTWTCLVRCNVQKSNLALPDCPDTIEDYGHGNSPAEAKYNGEIACKAQLRGIANGRMMGCYTRHCHPVRCWRN
ncbi:MAG: hypothetical protein IPN69_18825 [Acidobacteria bacterium]|nr:hypothetical protein [Acidobacteriota bacterium]